MAGTTQTVSPAGFERALHRILERFDKDVIYNADAVMRETVKNLFGSIIEDTPVGDFDPSHAGTLKGGWQISVGAPATTKIRRQMPSRTRDRLRIPRIVGPTGAVQVFLTNNEDYINVVEYGGYTKSPKLGTWDKRTGRYVIRSRGGYSKQAPKGMVRKHMNRSAKFLEEAANKTLFRQ